MNRIIIIYGVPYCYKLSNVFKDMKISNKDNQLPRCFDVISLN